MAGLSATERALRRRLREDFAGYAERCLRIRSKAGRMQPLLLNPCQQEVHARLETQRGQSGRVRALILKARQWGCSTYVEGRFYWRVTHRHGVRAMVMAHKRDASNNLFAMVERFHGHCPPGWRPHTSAANARELRFDALDSGYIVATAGTAEVGRSDTVQYFHGSEVAFWPRAEQHAAGVLQTVPDADDTEVVLESTANGVGGLFCELFRAAQRGEGPYQAIFVPWFAHAEYQARGPDGWQAPAAIGEYATLHRLSTTQAYWCWRKNAELARACGGQADEICWMFRQEYPATAEEAFQAGGHESFIRSDLVTAARHGRSADQSAAPLVLGVDTARGGPDKTRIIDRQGRCAGHLVNETLDSDDEMEIAGRLARLIDRHEPDAVFIDVTGGTGKGTYDRLRELGYGRMVTGVNFGAAAIKHGEYANRRAEIWGELRDWLREPGGVDLPDDDALHAHICAPGYGFDSLSRLRLEKKEAIRARLGFSPDGGDALALTFAEPVAKLHRRRQRAQTGGTGPAAGDAEMMAGPFA